MNPFDNVGPMVLVLAFFVVNVIVQRRRKRRARLASPASASAKPAGTTTRATAENRGRASIAALYGRQAAQIAETPTPAAAVSSLVPLPARPTVAPVLAALPAARVGIPTPRLQRARYGVNALIAAEVFGPPLAARPGGTLGSPNAF